MTTDEELRLIDKKYKIEKILKELKKKKWTLHYEDDIMIQFTQPLVSKDNFRFFEYFKEDKTCSFSARYIQDMPLYIGIPLNIDLPLDEVELFVEYFKLRGVKWDINLELG